jgi:hypothetical protein
MRKVVLTYGLIMGAITGGMIIVAIPFWNNGMLNYDSGQAVGFTSIIVASSLIFFGMKSFRDNYAGGEVTYWQAAKVGLLIMLVSSVVYAACWEASIGYMPGDFMQMMTDHEIGEMRADGASDEEIKEMEEDMAAFGEIYKNPIIRFAITMIEPLPFALIVILGSAGLLRNRKFLPAENNVAKAV